MESVRLIPILIHGVTFLMTSRLTKQRSYAKVMPQGIDIPTYHIGVHKTIGVSYSRVILRLHHIQRNDVVPFH